MPWVYIVECRDSSFYVGSAWDLEAARVLSAYVRKVPAVAVVLFNIDDDEPDGLLHRRFPGVEVRPYAVPVIARYRVGRLEWVEQGRAAVDRLEGLAPGVPP